MKQVIVVRRDLKIGKGKLAVQVAHASVSAALEAQKKFQSWFNEWLEQGQKKVVVKVENEEALLEIYSQAIRLGLPCSLVRDAGLTQLPPGTPTAVGIGPAPAEIVDKVTGKLKLL
ncbi:MAG: peptidyl-tRNA hydrolase [Thermoprotei archaeon]|nr:MAG: peptidyl-tRNA hydrolase [Thermoprotei archaeon]